MKKLSGIVAFLAAILILTTGIVLYARGYRPNLRERSLEATGVVSIKSKPSGATVYIDGEQKGTTDLDIPELSPGKYKIKVTKEGFSTWEKEISLKKEVVKPIEAILFPIAPSLKALTFTGVTNPRLSPAGDKIVFALQNKNQGETGSSGSQSGIWALNLTTNPLPSFLSKDLKELVSDTKEFAFSSSEFDFSPDGKQLLVKLASQSIYFLIDTSKKNENPKEVTLDVEKIKQDWDKKASSSRKNQLKSLGESAESLTASLTNLVFSPDKNSFFGSKIDGSTILYDGKPKPDGSKEPKIFNLPAAEKYSWYPDSEHVILVNKNIISIVEADSANNVPIYTGTFDPNFVVPWPDGSRLVITTNLNSNAASLPNLYAIELH